MSEEQVQEAPPQEAPEMEAPAQVEAQQEYAPQEHNPQQEQGFSSPYEAFSHLPEFQGQDDLTIARNLYGAYNGLQESQRQLQQYQQVVPYAQEYLRNKNAFDEWQTQQHQAAQQAAQPEPPPKWWNPPEVKDSWKSYIVRDPESGKEIIDPGAPLDAQTALRDYQTYTADFARKLVTDPEAALKPMVEQIANQKAQELVSQHLGQYQAQNYVNNLESENADWLYDSEGNVTREGQAIQSYIEQARQLGIQNPDARWDYATGMLQRDLLQLQYQQQQAPVPQQAPVAQEQVAPQQAPVPQPAADPVAQQNMQFLRERATRTPNRSAGTTEPQTQQGQRMSFEERLQSQLTRDGVI
jgi:hypothetical protein